MQATRSSHANALARLALRRANVGDEIKDAHQLVGVYEFREGRQGGEDFLMFIALLAC